MTIVVPMGSHPLVAVPGAGMQAYFPSRVQVVLVVVFGEVGFIEYVITNV